MGIHGHKFVPSGKGQVAGSGIGELPIPMKDITVKPTEEEAQQYGFKSAKEWYHYSTGGALPRTITDVHFDSLPTPETRRQSEGARSSSSSGPPADPLEEDHPKDLSAAQNFALNSQTSYEDEGGEEDELLR